VDIMQMPSTSKTVLQNSQLGTSKIDTHIDRTLA